MFTWFVLSSHHNSTITINNSSKGMPVLSQGLKHWIHGLPTWKRREWGSSQVGTMLSSAMLVAFGQGCHGQEAGLATEGWFYLVSTVAESLGTNAKCWRREGVCPVFLHIQSEEVGLGRFANREPCFLGH